LFDTIAECLIDFTNDDGEDIDFFFLNTISAFACAVYFSDILYVFYFLYPLSLCATMKNDGF